MCIVLGSDGMEGNGRSERGRTDRSLLLFIKRRSLPNNAPASRYVCFRESRSFHRLSRHNALSQHTCFRLTYLASLANRSKVMKSPSMMLPHSAAPLFLIMISFRLDFPCFFYCYFCVMCVKNCKCVQH